MVKKRILIPICSVLLLTLLCVLCLVGCKETAPTAEGILVRFGDSSMSSRGGDPLTVSVAAGDTPETIGLENKMTVELQMSDGTTKPLSRGADGYRIEGAFDPIFEVKAGEGDDEQRLWADNDPDEEMPIGNCYMDEDGNMRFIGYFGRGMQAYIVTVDGVEYLPVRFRSCLIGYIYADEECTVPLTAGEVRLAVQTEGDSRYVAAYVMVGGDRIICRFYLEDHDYPATITAGDKDYRLRLDPNSMDLGDLVVGEDGFELTLPAGTTTVTLKLTRIYADESYTIYDPATGNIFRVTDQDTLSVEIPLTFTDGVTMLYICPEGTTNLADDGYPIIFRLAAAPEQTQND